MSLSPVRFCMDSTINISQYKALEIFPTKAEAIASFAVAAHSFDQPMVG